jgi:hypothetical protein
MAPRSLYLLPHVPKCAGSTVEAHFAAQLGPAAVLLNRRSTGIKWTPDDLPEEQRDAIRVIAGHHVPRRTCLAFGGARVREAVLIRDPVSYKVSFYNFLRARPIRPLPPDLEFEAWYRRSRKNLIVQFLLDHYFQLVFFDYRRWTGRMTLDFISDQFSRFWFVGPHTACGDLIRRIARDLRVAEDYAAANVATPGALKVGHLPPCLVTRILEENAVDAALYERWGRQVHCHDPMPAAAPGNEARARPSVG